jgi:Flp pilus assembly protein TadG
MHIKLKRGQGRAQSGAMMVEFAILIPFLLLLLAGIAEIGYTYFHLNVLNKSVQDAARWFSDPAHARNNVKSDPIVLSTFNTATQNLVKYGNTASNGSPLLPNGGSTNVIVSCISDTGVVSNTTCPLSNYHHIRVSATYSHTYMLGNLLRNLCGNCIPATNYPLTASAVFRVEGGS